jgi:ABC-type branched-subunit amino acid transport system substrate-binding protein
MKASSINIKKGNVIVFNCDEYRNGNTSEYDGHVVSVCDKGVDVIYLSGYKSRNDFIKWKDILAKLDRRKPWIKLTNAAYKGQFLQFD